MYRKPLTPQHDREQTSLRGKIIVYREPMVVGNKDRQRPSTCNISILGQPRWWGVSYWQENMEWFGCGCRWDITHSPEQTSGAIN